MMQGEFEFVDDFVAGAISQRPTQRLLYPYITFTIFVIFLITMAIVLMNMMVIIIMISINIIIKMLFAILFKSIYLYYRVLNHVY